MTAHLPRKVTSSKTTSLVCGPGRPDPLRFHKLPMADAVQRINQEYFVMRPSGKIYREGEDGELNALSKSDFKTAIGGRMAEYIDSKGQPKPRPAADAWHDSPDRREYAGIEYCPNNRGARPNYKNLWREWGIAPAAGDCTVILEHTREVLANGDQAKADFFLDWQADIVQNPTRKPNVAVVFRGSQGSGKTVGVEILRRVLGRANVLVTPEKDRMLGRFNAAVMNKILLVGEEMLFAGDRATTDKLKHLITGPTIPVEFKFGDQLEVKSFHRLVLTSNHAQVFQAASEERRFVTYDVSDAKRGDADYFERLYAIADGRDDATAAAFMHFLLTRDISGFIPWKAQQGFANDAALQYQKLLSLTPPGGSVRSWRLWTRRGSRVTTNGSTVCRMKRGSCSISNAGGHLSLLGEKHLMPSAIGPARPSLTASPSSPAARSDSGARSARSFRRRELAAKSAAASAS